MGIQTKRAYDPVGDSDGYRVLVDGMWPRGIKREDLALDDWWRDVAPSAPLRRWFAHRHERWPEFARRYRHELQSHEPRIRELAARAASETVTLIFASRDRECNNAVVIRDLVSERLACGDGSA